MITEQRRRAYLEAMQVVSWLPRAQLPFAPAARIELRVLPKQPVSVADAPPIKPVVQRAAAASIQDVRNRLEPKSTVETSKSPAVSVPQPVAVKVPRFSLQLYRAGNCLLLVEPPTGEALQGRDPAYLLLRDLLRAAGLPDHPQTLGEPVRWPLLVGSNLDQGPAAARDFLQGYLAARLEEGPPCACLWLVGLSALRHVVAEEGGMYGRELQIDRLGTVWLLPGLELLMDEPQRKAELWQAMRKSMPRWKPRE